MSLYTLIALGYIIPRAEAQPIGAVSSGVEHYLDTVGVTSSNLVSPTNQYTGHGKSPWPVLFISSFARRTGAP